MFYRNIYKGDLFYLTVQEVLKILNGKLLYDADTEQEILSVCGSDLMSDVLASVRDHTALLTGLTNLQVIRTAEMMDISVIIFVRGKRPTDEVIQMGQERNISLMFTSHTMFTTCGLLYEAGLRGDKA